MIYTNSVFSVFFRVYLCTFLLAKRHGVDLLLILETGSTWGDGGQSSVMTMITTGVAPMNIGALCSITSQRYHMFHLYLASDDFPLQFCQTTKCDI